MPPPCRKTPTGELYTFYARLRLKPPEYDYEEKTDEDGFPCRPPIWLCTLAIQGVSTEGGFPRKTFLHEGSTKKEAKRHVSATALEYIKKFDAFQLSKSHRMSVWKCLKDVMGGQAGSDFETRMHIRLAEKYNDGWVPVATLLRTRELLCWTEDCADNMFGDYPALLQRVRAQARAESRGDDAELELSSCGGFVRRRTRAMLRMRDGATFKMVPAIDVNIPHVPHAPGSTWRALRVPADCSREPEVVEIPFGDNYLQQIAAVLQCSIEDVVLWGRCGPKFTFIDEKQFMQQRTGPAGRKASKHGGYNGSHPVDERGIIGDDAASDIDDDDYFDDDEIADGDMAQDVEGSADDAGRAVVDGSTAQRDGHDGSGSDDEDGDDKDDDIVDDKDDGGDDAHAGGSCKKSRCSAPIWKNGKTFSEVYRETYGDDAPSHVVAGLMPSVYTRACDACAPINLRATWIAGAAVRGDALLSAIRFSYAVEGYSCIKWRHFTAQDFWRCVNARFPTHQYARTLQSPLVARLPHKYVRASRWMGSTPSQLLDGYYATFWWLPPPVWEYVESEGGLRKPRWSARVTAQPLCCAAGHGGTAEAASAMLEDKRAAKEAAALELLHRLQSMDVHALCSTAGSMHGGTDEGDSAVSHMEEIERGNVDRGAKPLRGHAAVIDYRIELMAANGVQCSGMRAKRKSDGAMCVEGRSNFEVMVGADGMLPALDVALLDMFEGGQAACAVQVHLEGPDVVRQQHGTAAMLYVELKRINRVRTHAPATIGLFRPGLGQQRRTFLRELIHARCPTKIIDIGCGRFHLLYSLWKYNPYPNMGAAHMFGIDCDTEALQRARMKLARGIIADEQLPDRQHLIPRFGLVDADVGADALMSSDAWGELAHADLVIAQEVVEHLDPGVLRRFGRNVLGAMRPKMLVVTTPNREYNAVLRLLGGDMDGPVAPNGIAMRHWDHRFEFDREEFHKWADQLAQTYGYDVRYEEIGKAAKEEEFYSAHPGMDGLGAATQVAIFELRDDDCASTATQSRCTAAAEPIQFYWDSKHMHPDDVFRDDERGFDGADDGEGETAVVQQEWRGGNPLLQLYSSGAGWFN